ncbi:hypothetical protein H0H87_000359, partial [Tephrocybe sp. NHM501043]
MTPTSNPALATAVSAQGAGSGPITITQPDNLASADTARLALTFSAKAWNVAETTLRAVAKSADAFPPLKSATSGLVACLDLVQAAAANREDYDKITSELAFITGIVNRYAALEPTDRTGSAGRILLSVENEAAQIVEKQAHRKARQIFESSKDKDHVISCFRTIESLFHQLQIEISLQTLDNTQQATERDLLRGLSPALGARYDSGLGFSSDIRRRGCTQGTREKILADLKDWSQDQSAPKVYWMEGMAGTGKTTIMEQQQPTELNIPTQLQRLLGEPLKAAKAFPPGVVFVIDALDECEDRKLVQLLLDTLLESAANLPLKFFITSRPEFSIRDRMYARHRYLPSILHLHDIEQSIVEADIYKYLLDTLDNISPPLPLADLQLLTKHAGKLFIYAATAAQFIKPGPWPVDHHERLKIMLRTSATVSTSVQYRELDMLYRNILEAAFHEKLEAKEKEIMKLVLQTVLCAKEPLSAQTMASLLGLPQKSVEIALEPLRS